MYFYDSATAMSYNFPQLNVPDILGCMDDLFNIQLDEKAFKKIDVRENVFYEFNMNITLC